MAAETRYPEITVSGAPRELGRQIGEVLREPIRAFCGVAMERVNRLVKISRPAAMQIAEESIPYAQHYCPDSLEELQGTAEAVGVSLADLMLLQIRNQLRPIEGGCTSFSIGQPRRAERMVAQNWDSDPALDDFTVVLTRRPTGKVGFTTITQAGLIAYIGFNEAGLGLCANTLPAPTKRLGVPHYFLLRGILESSSLDQAVAAVRRAERAMPANVMLTTPQGPADLEITVDSVKLLTGEGLGIVTHTNHCLHPSLRPINDAFPELIQSHSRQTRIDQLLVANETSAASAHSSIETIKQALRDHDNYPRSICRHTNDDEPTGYWKTVFSVIIEPEQQQMHISRGNPCTEPYETYAATGSSPPRRMTGLE